jgi:hypothetical protein
MTEKTFTYAHPGKYDRNVLTMVGVLMASCGGIERVITTTLLHFRDEGRNVGQVHMQFKRRLKQWHKHVTDDLPPLKEHIDLLQKRTESLFKFRDAIVHSLWMGQDNEGTLWLSAIKDKSMKVMTLNMPIPKKELIRTVAAGESLLREHLKLLVEGVLGRPPDQGREFFQPISADPSDPTHPNQTGSPYRDLED